MKLEIQISFKWGDYVRLGDYLLSAVYLPHVPLPACLWQRLGKFYANARVIK